MRAAAGPYSPENPSTGHTLEKQALRGRCLMDTADMILPPERGWPSELVECVNCVTSQLNISPVSAFYGMESKPSNITFKVLYQEVLSDRFSSSTLEVHSTPILKTQKASHPLLTLDVQHALSFPWSSLLPSFATLHIPLLVISCSSLAPSLVLLPWKASLSPHPWFRRMSASIASHAAPIPPHYAGVSPSRL